jgi:hypothetical protein
MSHVPPSLQQLGYLLQICCTHGSQFVGVIGAPTVHGPCGAHVGGADGRLADPHAPLVAIANNSHTCQEADFRSVITGDPLFVIRQRSRPESFPGTMFLPFSRKTR